MTDMQKSDGAILRTDRKGRVQTPAARRETLLDEFERSGLSGKKFALLVGIKHQTFATWAQKRRRQRGDYAAGKMASEKKSVRWLEAVMEPPPGSVVKAGALFLVLHLPGGVRVEMSEVKQVEMAAALVRALARPC